MTPKTFFHLSEAIFALVALAHLLRVVYGLELVVAGWQVPVWVSVIGLVVAGTLALLARRLARS